LDGEEWAACEEPARMLRHLRHLAGKDRDWVWFGAPHYPGPPRKIRLFLLAACRHALPGERGVAERDLLALAERHCETTAGVMQEELAPFRGMRGLPGGALAVWGALSTWLGIAASTLRRYADGAARSATREKAARMAAGAAALAREKAAQCRLLRCIFGVPSHPPRLAPSSVTAAAASVAQAAYEEVLTPSGEMEPLRLAILADALEEGGEVGEALSHLRGPGPHVRGCWVVDAILGRT
jgi:hypothetical protein